MPSQIVSLLVICHGLWGETKHVQQLANEAEKRCGASTREPEDFEYDEPPAISRARQTSVADIGFTPANTKLVVYLVKSNEGTNTYDGIDLCAERVCEEIDAEIERIHTEGVGIVRRFSIVGYSLGGLIARYSIGLLHSRKPSFFTDVRPVNFATIASPAIGMTRDPGARSAFRAYAGARFLSRTGRQLFVIDNFAHGKPLLEIMAEPGSSFYEAMSAFERVEIYGNITKDITVTYPTGCIDVGHNRFEQAIRDIKKARSQVGIAEDKPIVDLREGGIDLEMHPKYPPIVVSYKDCEPLKPADDPSRPARRRNFVPHSLRPSSYPWWPPAVRYLFVFTFPIAFPLFLLMVSSVFTVQSRKSRNRIRVLRKKLGLEARSSTLTRVGLQERMDEMVDVTMMSREIDDDGKDVSEFATEGEPRGPYDAMVTPAQQRMAKHLNAIPQLRKHLAYFSEGWNAHAMIICRDPAQYPQHEAGRAVLRHWCDGFRL